MPERIQRKRTKGWRMPEGAVSVTRPSEWGNPFAITKVRDVTAGRDEWVVKFGARIWFFKSRQEAVMAAVDLFRAWLHSPRQERHRARAVLALRGKDLACYCPPGQACHADVLIELANTPVGAVGERE